MSIVNRRNAVLGWLTWRSGSESSPSQGAARAVPAAQRTSGRTSAAKVARRRELPRSQAPSLSEGEARRQRRPRQHRLETGGPQRRVGVRIRHAEPSDHARVAAVIDDWWGGRAMRDMLPRLFFTHFRDTSFVAEDGGELAGFLCGFLSQTYPDQAYCHFVGVAPAHRGAGSRASCTSASSRPRAPPAGPSVHCVTSPGEHRLDRVPPRARLRDRGRGRGLRRLRREPRAARRSASEVRVRCPVVRWPSPLSEAPFVHLHVHSEYSILDGACRIPALAARAAELEMPAVTLTDHGSLAGAVELHREAGKHGIKPIVGCELYVADDRTQAGEGVRPPDRPRRVERGVREPDQALLARLPGGLLLQAARRLGAARAARQGARRASPAASPAASRRRSRRRGRRTPPPTSTGSSRSSAATRRTSRSRTPASSRRRGSTRSSRSSPRRPGCRSSPRATSTTCATRTRARTRRSSASSRATR